MNKSVPIIIVIVLVSLLGGYSFYAFFLFDLINSAYRLTISLVLGFVLIAINIFLTIFLYLFLKRRRIHIERSFNFYATEMMESVGTGIIIFNKDNEIIWVSKFLEKRINKNLIGRKILSLSESFANGLQKGYKQFRFSIKNIFFESEVNFENKVITIKDITHEATLLKEYANEKPIMGEIEIDNFQEYQTTLPQEEVFRVQSEVIKCLDELVEKYNIAYRQYVNGKYVIFSNQKTLESLTKNNFSFFNSLREVQIKDGIQLSLSIGFGIGTTIQNQLVLLAKEALLQAQSRGGDQICINSLGEQPIYYGSHTEGAKSISKVKIKQMAYVLENRLKDKATKRIIVYGHKNADLDALGASLGVVEIAKMFNKEVYIQNTTFDETTKNAVKKLLTKKDIENVFISPKKATQLTHSKNTLSIVVDTSNLKLIENENLLKDNTKEKSDSIFIFDHHRVMTLPNQIKSENIYIDTTASSASEIIVELIQFFKKVIKIRSSVAQMLLNGIYLDTMQFQKSTSARTFQAASFLESKGALPIISTDILKISESSIGIIQKITSNVQEIKPGFFLSVFNKEVGGDIISKAADEILRVSNRKAAFVIGKIPGTNSYKLSARGVDTNVQIIVENVGGGGHFSAAAAISNEPLDVFKDNIIQSIVERGEN